MASASSLAVNKRQAEATRREMELRDAAKTSTTKKDPDNTNTNETTTKNNVFSGG